MVFDTMSDARQIIGLGDPVKGWGDRRQTVRGLGALKEDFAIIMDFGIVFREGRCATCIAQFSN